MSVNHTENLRSGFQMAVTCGILVASLINAGTERLPSTAAWRITMAIDFLWVLLLVGGLPFLPESPKYIYGKGKPETAKAIMARLMGVSDDHSVLQRELQQMAEKLALEQTTHDQPWWLVFRSRNVLTRTLLATGVLSFQQLTGANFFFYYGTTIFAATGLSNSYITQIILAAVNVACTLPGLYFGQKLSHRRCLILGGLWMSVCFILFASIGHFSLDRNDPSRTLPAGRALIAFGTLFVAAFASTWGPMSWGDAAALCPAHCRAICMSVATAVYWIWSFLLAFFTPMITERIDYLYGYVFAGCCFMMALMVYFFLVESQGRTLEEIDTMYLDPERQRWCWKRLWSVKKN
jgi:SP family sugar:H+ symporter-like MFS transporter